MEKLPKWMAWGYLVLFALLPWSLECSFGAWKMNVPSEPLIATLGIGLFAYVLKNPDAIRTAFSNYFLLKISVVWIVWLAVSACFSTMPLVSWKYWVVEAGNWWVFALGIAMFPSVWPQAVRLFALSMAGMVVFTLIHHSFYHFRADQALLAPMPFFPESTLYAAALAMVVFMKHKGTEAQKWLVLVFVAGLWFSFCRAAWISVFVAGVVGFFLIFRGKWRLLALASGLLLIIGMTFGGRLFGEMTKDVSMQERFNRYACALRMAREKPLTGFGPGTFQFQYVPFQKEEEMTRISAREPVVERSPHTFGRGGGAHSEFFQALSEAGWPGFFLWTFMVFIVLGAGFKRFFRAKEKESQLNALALTLGLLTFFLHAFVNNMLHDGRVAALFWGMAVMVGGNSGSDSSSSSSN